MTPSSKSHVSHPPGASPSASFFAEGSECLWKISSAFLKRASSLYFVHPTREFSAVFFKSLVWLFCRWYYRSVSMEVCLILKRIYRKKITSNYEKTLYFFQSKHENIWQASDNLRTKSLPEGGPAWEMALSPNGFFILRYPINRLCNYVKQIHALACNVQAPTTG